MGARVSATGVTKFGFGETDPTVRTSQEAESAAIAFNGDGVPAGAAQTPAAQHAGGSAGASAGRKVAGATRTQGGAL
jgi:hypothetical protein